MNELKTKQELMFCSAKVLHILIHFPRDVLLNLWLAGVTKKYRRHVGFVSRVHQGESRAVVCFSRIKLSHMIRV